LIGYSFDPLASKDVLKIAREYEERSVGLGKKFRDELAAVINLLRRLPRSAPGVRGNLRRKSMDRFPYSLIYAIEENEIRIYAVMHHRRRPDAWMKRIRR
jgi:plasmid stabilization system protein ParE